jgi:hypothetical protein
MPSKWAAFALFQAVFSVILAPSVPFPFGHCSNEQCIPGLIEKADFQVTARHIDMLFFFEWGNSSVLNDKANC